MTTDLPAHESRAIASYVEGQINKGDDPDREWYEITLVQKIRSYRLLGTDYEIFDVHTTEERYWVITPMTNLYLQSRFPSYDETFSFHVGLIQRMMERERTEIPEDVEESVGKAWTRYEEAVESLNHAKEAADYQSVAIRCREALIAFGQQYREEPWLKIGEEQPKDSDFKGWAGLYAQGLATGRVRRYLIAVAEKTWDLANSFQHNSKSTEWDAEIVLEATSHVLSIFGTAIVQNTRRPRAQCPKCDSYRFSTTGDYEVRDGQEGWTSRDVCSACGYQGTESFNHWE